MKTANELFEAYLPMIEEGLNSFLPPECAEDPECSVLHRAMRYAVLGGGKRIRPVLTMEFCHLCGGDPAEALPFACALELIHSYSLIHDDLPCMDNDDLRRGKPSVHKAFGEATALLAGDALLNRAFETALSAKSVEAKTALAAARCLAELSGVSGMIGGQMIDLQSEGKRVETDTLRRMDIGKTVALIRAACRMGCIIGGCQDRISAADVYAENVGLAFQIRDDMLDVEGDIALLGKPVGSDRENEKSTYVSLLGTEQAGVLVEQMTQNARQAVAPFGEAAAALCDLAEMLAHRSR